MDQTNSLTAQDRCDRCGAQAYMRTSHNLADGRSLPLLWCNHHFQEHESRGEQGGRYLTPFLVTYSSVAEKTKEPAGT